MAKKPSANEQTNKQTPELLGIIAIGLAVMVGLSVFSYDPADPSWGAASTAPGVANLIGRFGAYLSDFLFQIIGGGAFLLPVYLLVYGINKAAGRERSHRLLKSVGALILIVSFATLLRLTGEHLPLGGIRSGGLVGEVIVTRALFVFGRFGAYTLCVTLLLCGLAISSRFSLVSLYKTVLWLWGAAQDRFGTLMIMRAERKNKSRAREARAVSTPSTRPDIVEHGPASAPRATVQESLPLGGPDKGYKLPPVSMLDEPRVIDRKVNRDSLLASANMLEKRIRDFGVEGRVSQVHAGPVVTMYEFEPASGVKVSKVASLEDDLALAMRAESVRIVAPIPGKAAVGIEIPNNVREDVYLKEILTSPEFAKSRSPLTLALGKDIYGAPVVADMAKMPHLLVAGATGSGKSVAINTMTMSLLMNAMPYDLRMVMVDPKRLELSVYDGIAHLLEAVITEPRRASEALRRLVVVMEERYKLLATRGVRNIEGFNQKVLSEKAHPKFGAKKDPEEEELPKFAVLNDDGTLPYIVVIIDELADLMMVAAKEVEDSIARLAQMARAAGIHLLLATQRPSVDVLTGVIKANFPARMSFQVSSKTDSRTILDANGAQALLGKGDMLFLPPGTSKLIRIHGSYVTEEEISRVVSYLKKQARPRYDLFCAITPPTFNPKKTRSGGPADGEDGRDERYEQAVELVVTVGKASASLLQRRMRIGYPTASRIIERMEDEGIIGPKKEGGKEREVLIRSKD